MELQIPKQEPIMPAPKEPASNTTTTTSTEESESNIARRTRSHLRIDGFEPDDNLNFPDVDMSLYQNPDSELDPDYRKFLNQTYSAEICNTDTYTDDNDPEYVYNDDCFSHGWRFDYMAELRQDEYINQASSSTVHDNTTQQLGSSKQYITLQNAQQPQHPCSSTSQGGEPKQSSSKSNRRKIDMFDDPEFARILNQQLRQHIQLLTQTYLLTKNTTNMRNKAEEAKTHLDSYMRIFKHKTKPSNLLAAINLINNLVAPKDLYSFIRFSWRPIPVPDQVRRIIQNNPNIFIYPSLLPQVAFSFLPENKLNEKKSKINFTINEDKLLAFALNEFKGETSQYALIASLLMATKTKMQISNHIKNIKRSPGNENNPIKLYYANGQLPEIDVDSDSHLVILGPKKEPDTGGEEEKEQRPSRSQPDNKNLNKQEVIELDNKEEDRPSPVKIKFHITAYSDDSDIRPPPPPAVAQTPNNIEMRTDGKRVKLVHLPPSDIKIETPFSEIATERFVDPSEEPQISRDREERSKMIQLDMIEPPSNQTLAMQNPGISQNNGSDMMNMDLDDLMAISTTIAKQPVASVCSNNNNNTNVNASKNLKNLKMKQSMLNLMTHQFSLPSQTGGLLIQSFLRTAQMKLTERNNLHLLQLLTDLLRREGKKGKEDTQTVAIIYKEIVKFLKRIEAPMELKERLVLFLDLEQANACGLSIDYLHWMRFFEFMQHVEIYYKGDETLEKKLTRLVNALAKDDAHKVKLAVGNLVNKHPLLRRDFEALDLDEKPHPSLFICQEDFDDITKPVSLIDEFARRLPTTISNIDEFEWLW